MCTYCENLIKCPVGEKRKTLLSGQYEYGRIMEMVLDRYVDRNEVFIHASFVDIDGSWHNLSHDIKYCPMCGEELK